MSKITWIHHAALERWSEVVEESLEVWLDNGWEHRPEGPPQAPGRYSESELAARAAITGLPVVPSEDVSIETPAADASTEPASLKKDSGNPQED